MTTSNNGGRLLYRSRRRLGRRILGGRGSTVGQIESLTGRPTIDGLTGTLRYHDFMRVTTGRVVNGKIEVPDEELAEGLVVTILAPEGHGTFRLGPEAEAALIAAMEEGNRGEVVSGDDLLRELREG